MIDKPKGIAYLRARLQALKASASLLLAGICLLGGPAGQSYAGAVQEFNAGRGGQTINLKSLPVKGKATIVDFYSLYCPPCKTIGPLLEQLTQKRPELAIQKVDIQRPEVKGKIDWQSPLAQQLGLRSIPHFMIYDSKGNLTAQGPEAMKRVGEMLQEAGLLQKKPRRER